MSVSIPRPAKAAACANFTDLLIRQFQYPADLAATVANTVVDPAEVRRRLAEGAYQTGPHGVLTLNTRAWLPMLAPVYLGFDFRFMRNGGQALSGPADPPRLSGPWVDERRDIDEAWVPHPSLNPPDNRAWVADHLDRHDWVWDGETAFRAVPLTWVTTDGDSTREQSIVTLLDGSEVLYSARDLLVTRLTALGAQPDDLDRFLRRDRDALRRMVDVIHAALPEADRAWADEVWLISVPIRLHLAVPTTSGGWTAVGLADAIRSTLNDAKRSAKEAVRARYITGQHVTDRAALAEGKQAILRLIADPAYRNDNAPEGTADTDEFRAALARGKAVLAWIMAREDDATLTYRCASHATLPEGCSCPPDADRTESYDPLCIEHGDFDGCDDGYGCVAERLDPRWATKAAWAARLFTHRSTRGNLTLPQARDAFAAFVDTYVGFDSPTTVAQAKAILTEEVWNDAAVPTEAALTSLNNIAHVPLDLGVDAVRDLYDGTSREYVIGHLLGLFVALDRGMLNGAPAERVSALASAMYRSQAGRTQLLALAQAHADLSAFDDETTVHTARAIGLDGNPVLDDEFGQPMVLGRGDFLRIWWPLATAEASR